MTLLGIHQSMLYLQPPRPLPAHQPPADRERAPARQRPPAYHPPSASQPVPKCLPSL